MRETESIILDVCGVVFLSRYHVCLQLRMDLCSGQLHCSTEQLISLSALIIQCTFHMASNACSLRLFFGLLSYASDSQLIL